MVLWAGQRPYCGIAWWDTRGRSFGTSTVMRGVFSRQAPPDWQLGISGDALIRLAYSVQAHRSELFSIAIVAANIPN